MTAVGIDVGKASLDVAIEGRPGVLQIANNAAGIRKLVRQLAGLLEARIVVEATADTKSRCWKPAATPACGGPGQSPAGPQLRPRGG